MRQDIEQHFQDQIKTNLDRTWEITLQSINESSHILDQKMEGQMREMEATFMEKLSEQQDKIERQEREIASLRGVVTVLSNKLGIQVTVSVIMIITPKLL